MATSDEPTGAEESSIHEEYVLGVRIRELIEDGTTRYRFEAPDHRGITFDDPETAELYADVYFDANGFVEAGTGDRGIPPTVIQAGRDTLAAYLLTQPEVDVDWVASFFGRRPGQIEKYVSIVKDRAAEIRAGAVERGMT